MDIRWSFVILAVVAAVKCSEPGCDHGWFLYNDKCYSFSYDKATWNEAVDRCRKVDAHLADIDDHGENEFISEFVKDNFPASNQYVYFGMSDRREEGKWVNEHTGGHPWYTNWNAGEPNGTPQDTQDCVALIIASGKWDDVRCNNHFRYICERRVHRWA
ncbi:hypothetical protein ScPMuIL_013733 [Solemya velum]